MSSVTQLDGAAIGRRQNRSPQVDMINQRNVLMPECFAGQKPKATPISDKDLHERLGEILTMCKNALGVTYMADGYTQALWSRTIAEHHLDWKNHSLPWLFPDGKELQKDYRGELHEKYLATLKGYKWNRSSIMDFLKVLYRRFQHIAVGIAIVQNMNERDENVESVNLKNAEKLSESKKLFNHSASGVRQVLCEIHTTILDLSYEPDTNPTISPEKMDELVKLKHWLVYREYENLLEYASKLLQMITGDAGFKQSALQSN